MSGKQSGGGWLSPVEGGWRIKSSTRTAEKLCEVWQSGGEAVLVQSPMVRGSRERGARRCCTRGGRRILSRFPIVEENLLRRSIAVVYVNRRVHHRMIKLEHRGHVRLLAEDRIDPLEARAHLFQHFCERHIPIFFFNPTTGTILAMFSCHIFSLVRGKSLLEATAGELKRRVPLVHPNCKDIESLPF